MLKFNGISMNDVAPIKCTDIFISAPKIKTFTDDTPVLNGEHFIRSKYEPRKISVSFYFRGGTASTRDKWMQYIYQWAHSSEQEELIVPHKPGKYIMAKATSLPSISAMTENDIKKIEFTAYSPFFLDADYIAATCGIPFTVDGMDTASAYIQNVSATSVTDPSWQLDSDETIELDGTFDAGTMKVDLDLKKVYLDDVSQMQYVTLQSRFFELEPGTHTITGSGTVFYKQRWL